MPMDGTGSLTSSILVRKAGLIWHKCLRKRTNKKLIKVRQARKMLILATGSSKVLTRRFEAIAQ